MGDEKVVIDSTHLREPAGQFSVLEYLEKNHPNLSSSSLDSILFAFREHLSRIQSEESQLISSHQDDVLRLSGRLAAVRKGLATKLAQLDHTIHEKTVIVHHVEEGLCHLSNLGRAPSGDRGHPLPRE
jgi:hypothetical protein